MKSKSIVNIKADIFNKKRRLKWGEILAESYWKYDKDGRVVQSEPTTDEILAQFFHPFRVRLDGCSVWLEDYPTGIEIEEIEASTGVHIERLVFKPRSEASMDGGLLDQAMDKNFKKYYVANK